MVYKINVSHKGKTAKFEVDNEELIGILIGEKIDGKLISEELTNYSLLLTGTSDKAGFPGMNEIKGPALKRIILTRGKGMRSTIKGLRKRKTIRGNEISVDTVQLNFKVEKEGSKKFEEFISKKEDKKE